ncbi:hypothetical protein A2U01_0074016, partial [Trifolium medium]|nr:hypothetical protein [Trifolium medium]
MINPGVSEHRGADCAYYRPTHTE